jgi:hypothetical protein
VNLARHFGSAALVAVAVLAGPPLARGYQMLCAGPVDTYPLIAAERDAARGEAASSSSPTGVTPAVARAMALDLFLKVKQADPVAFPAHALAGAALEVGRCPARATGDQWRKAASHAWTDDAARLAAEGLKRTLGEEAGLETLRAYAADEPWHSGNLGRVERAYRSIASPPAE